MSVSLAPGWAAVQKGTEPRFPKPKVGGSTPLGTATCKKPPLMFHGFFAVFVPLPDAGGTPNVHRLSFDIAEVGKLRFAEQKVAEPYPQGFPISKEQGECPCRGSEAERIRASLGMGDECSKAVEGSQKLLHENQTPHEYKVAVIGRFKAGKSSFVNVLLDRRLAGVDTSPETAAVTTFRAGEKVVARIKFIDKTAWDELRACTRATPTDPAAHRIANWFKFGREQRLASVIKSRHSISPNWSGSSFGRMVTCLQFRLRQLRGGKPSERRIPNFSAELSNLHRAPNLITVSSN